MTRLGIAFGVICVVGVIGGCATRGGSDVAIASDVQPVDEEARLRAILADDIEKTRARESERSARLLFSKPFYYKEYWEFPAEESIFSADFTETESLSIPLTAEAEVERIRYATRATRNKSEARADENFLRSTGIQQISYELRHGQWRRVGSLFLADRTEEFRDGQWVQIDERKPIVVLEDDEKQGFWRRLVFWR
jgi:hypothetical protein